MSEFRSRIATQREILKIINKHVSVKEELFGLSTGAIQRWVSSNGIDRNSLLLSLVEAAAARLFFLSNKSQEQITDEYGAISQEISTLVQEIKLESQRACHLP